MLLFSAFLPISFFLFPLSFFLFPFALFLLFSSFLFFFSLPWIFFRGEIFIKPQSIGSICHVLHNSSVTQLGRSGMNLWEMEMGREKVKNSGG